MTKLDRASTLSLTGVCLALVGPLAANVRLLPPLVGFILFLAGTLVALGGAISETVTLVRRGKGNAGALLGYVPLLLVLMLLGKATAFPRINDVSTDLNEVPVFLEALKLRENAGRDMTYPEEFKPLSQKHYGDLTTKVAPGLPDEVMTRTIELIKQRPYLIVTREDRQAHEIEGVAESGFFRFKDDFILRFRGHRLATLVDMRSKSRDGKGDAGANATRIRAFLSAIEKGEW